MDDLINYLFTFENFSNVYEHALEDIRENINPYADHLEYDFNCIPDFYCSLGFGFFLGVNHHNFTYFVYYDVDLLFND